MLLASDEIFASTTPQVGILGKLNDNKNSIHVGCYWVYNDKKKFIHFLAKNNIMESAPDELKGYYGIKVSGFKNDLIPSLISLSGLILSSNLGNITINLKSVIYKGNKFSITTGKYIVDKEFENFINCGVFVLALFETFKITLLDWSSWPTVSEINRNPYLMLWLEDQKIPEDEHDEYYNFNKEIKGKHVISCPLVPPMPSSYGPVEVKSNEVVEYLKGV